MLTKKVKWRASLIGLLILATIVSIFYLLESLNKNILYFKSPTDVQLIKEKDLNKKIRIGGMVKKNSLKINNKEIKFVVTDFNNELIVSFSGTVPNLFSEGKGVVAEGKLQDKKFLSQIEYLQNMMKITCHLN